MLKQYKILLIIGGFFVLILVGFLITSSLSSPKTPSQGNNQPSQATSTTNLPDYLLSTSDEASLKEFVKNYVNLYNSYSYGDYSNLIALGDYQTQSMQEQVLASISEYEKTLPVGYKITTTADSATFQYSYPTAENLSATISARVSEVFGESQTPKQYGIKIQLQISQQKNGWLVKDIKINKE